MSYWTTVAVPCAPPSLVGRLLVPTPHAESTLRDVRSWMRRNAKTWTDALLPGEPGFTGFVVDQDGEPALTVEYGLDADAEPVEHTRAELAAMRGAS